MHTLPLRESGPESGNSLHSVFRFQLTKKPHPAATASDLPTPRGGNIQNPNVSKHRRTHSKLIPTDPSGALLERVEQIAITLWGLGNDARFAQPSLIVVTNSPLPEFGVCRPQPQTPQGLV